MSSQEETSLRKGTVLFSCLLPTSAPAEIREHLDYEFLEPVGQFDSVPTSRKTWPRILDNGFVEYGYKALTTQQMMSYAERWVPDYIAAPDREFDFSFNLKAARELFQAGVKRKGILVTLTALNPHLLQLQSWLVWLQGYGGVCLHRNNNRTAVQFPKGRVHLFGIRWPENLWYYQYLAPGRVTMDSVKPVTAALEGWNFERRGFASFPRPHDFLNIRMSSQEVALTIRNIEWFKKEIQRRCSNSPGKVRGEEWSRRPGVTYGR